MAPKEPMTLYYRTILYGPEESENSSLQKQEYSDVNRTTTNFTASKYMCTSDFKTPTTDIIHVSGVRLPSSNNLPSTFSETITITSKPYQRGNVSNMVVATATYVDSGSGQFTASNKINYAVTAASGKFEGYKNMQIIYDKDKIRRTVILS